MATETLRERVHRTARAMVVMDCVVLGFGVLALISGPPDPSFDARAVPLVALIAGGVILHAVLCWWLARATRPVAT